LLIFLQAEYCKPLAFICETSQIKDDHSSWSKLDLPLLTEVACDTEVSYCGRKLPKGPLAQVREKMRARDGSRIEIVTGANNDKKYQLTVLEMLACPCFMANNATSLPDDVKSVLDILCLPHVCKLCAWCRASRGMSLLPESESILLVCNLDMPHMNHLLIRGPPKVLS